MTSRSADRIRRRIRELTSPGRGVAVIEAASAIWSRHSMNLVLHGRTAEQAVLDGLVADAAEWRSRVLVVRGEPGVGKTALLDELAARRGRLRLLRCAAIESEVELPYAALHQLVYPLADRLDLLPSPQAHALRAAFGLEPAHGENHFVVAVAVLTLLADVAAESGVLCLVDDAHWLDQASANALGFAARRLHAEGVALVFAARERHEGWFDPAGLPTLTLRGLEADAAAALLTGQSPGLPAAVVRALVAGTGGNPLALVELPSALRPDQLSGQAPLPDPLPVGRTVEEIFAAAAHRQPDPTQRLLLLAAAENSGDVGVLLRAAAALGIEPSALGTAEQSGLVQIRDGRIEFRHPLVRSAIYQRAPSTARASAHRVLAEAYTDPEQADRRYGHLAAGALGPDAELAAQLAAEARRIGERYGAAAAAATWERSAGLTPQGPERELRLLVAAESAWVAGSPERALALLHKAEPLSSRTAAALHLRGLIELRCGEPEHAHQLLLDSAVQAALDDPHLALESLVMAGEAASFSGDPGRTVEIGRLAATIRDDAHADDAMTVLMLTGIAAGMSGEWNRAAAALRRVVDAAAASVNPVTLVRAGRAAFYIGDDDGARALHSRAVAIARRVGAIGALPLLLDRLAFSHLLAGRLNDAAIAADEGMHLAAQTGQHETRAHHLVTLALVESWRGSEETCRAHAAEALALADERGIVLVSSSVSWALGLLDLGQGRIPQALDRLAELVEGPGHPAVRLWATPDLVDAASRARHPDLAHEPLARYEQWAERNHAGWARAAALRCRAQLDAGPEALALLEQALELHSGAGRPLERARTRLVYGEALRRARRPNAARGHLRAALEEFDRAGARPWTARAAGELRATGETIRARDTTSVELLTPQELQIARLAADGTSNPTIAEQLFLSRRTVEYHLRKVFIKLGVASRSELARVGLQ